MPSFSSLEKALQYATQKLKPYVSGVLQTSVYDAVADVEQFRAISDVYGRSTTGAYQRRGINGGGVGDKSNMIPEMRGDLEMSIKNETPYNPFLNGVDETDGISQNAGRGNDLIGLINNGDGWNGVNYDWASCGPTNMIENTIETLKADKQHIKAMKTGLQEMGFEVK